MSVELDVAPTADSDKNYDSSLSLSVSKDDDVRSHGVELEDQSRGSGGSVSVDSSRHSDKDASATELVRVDAYGEPIGKSASEFTDAINLIKGTIGSGILSTPWAFSLASTIPSLIALVGVLILSSVSFLMVSQASKKTKKNTYAEIWDEAYGPKFGAFPDIVIAFLNFFTCVGYIILVGDFIPEAFSSFAPNFPLADRTPAILMCTFIILLPLTLFKDISSLRYSSIVGVLAIIYTFFVVAVRSFEYVEDGRPRDADDTEIIQAFSLNPSFFTALSVFYYAFDAHANAPIMYQEHEAAGRDFNSWKRIVWGGYAVVMVITTLFGIFAYVGFGDGVADNVLSTFPIDDDVIVVGRLAMALSVLSAYPLWFNSMRRSIDGIIFRLAPHEASENYRSLRFRRQVQCLIMIVFTMVLAIYITDFGYFIALVASALGVFEMYIIPGLLYLGAMKLETTREKAPAYIVVTLGVLFGILGSTITIIDWAAE